MRTDEFDDALYLLPSALQTRAAALRSHVSRAWCPRCREIGDTLELALMAARYREFTASAHLIGAAERLAGDHSHGPPLGPRGQGRVAGWPGPTADLVAVTA